MVTDSENRGMIATCSSALSTSPVSAPCHLSISSRVSRIASSSEVISGLAVSGPTVWIPRPLTIRSPAFCVSVNSASCACGNADPNDHGRRGTGGDAAIAEFGGGLLREFRVGELGFRREHAQVQPLQQLAAAIGVAGVCLREVDVGVDEARQQKATTVVVDGRRRVFGR